MLTLSKNMIIPSICSYTKLPRFVVRGLRASQVYLVLRIFQNRDLLKVNTQDGRCGFLTAP